MITIYTRTTCAYCPMVKRYLDLKKQKYEVINIDEDKKAEDYVVNQLRYMTVPITVFPHEADTTFVIGWKPHEMAKALDK